MNSHCLAGTTSDRKPTKKTLGSLEQAIRYLYKALSKNEGVYSPSRSSLITIACYAHQPETLWVTRLSKKLPSDDLLDKSLLRPQMRRRGDVMLQITSTNQHKRTQLWHLVIISLSVRWVTDWTDPVSSRAVRRSACVFCGGLLLGAPDDSVFVPILHNIGYIQYRNGYTLKSHLLPLQKLWIITLTKLNLLQLSTVSVSCTSICRRQIRNEA